MACIAAFALPHPPWSERVLVEAESFENLGGWVVDQQFMDQMGSPFLLAHGLGVPVRDAVTTVTLPGRACTASGSARGTGPQSRRSEDRNRGQNAVQALIAVFPPTLRAGSRC